MELTELRPVDVSIVNISISSDHQVRLIKTVNHNESWDLLERFFRKSYSKLPLCKFLGIFPRAKDRLKAGLWDVSDWSFFAQPPILIPCERIKIDSRIGAKECAGKRTAQRDVDLTREWILERDQTKKETR